MIFKRAFLWLIFVSLPVIFGLWGQNRFLSIGGQKQEKEISQTTVVSSPKQENISEEKIINIPSDNLDIPDASDRPLANIVSNLTETLKQLKPNFPSQSSSVVIPESHQESETFLVTRVIDGDTIEIESGEKVRYIGIDTPETVDPRRPVQFFGKEAAEKNRQLVEGKRVSLEKDISETDKYGRLLRYVWVSGEMVNLTLVEEGYARASSYPPDIKYQNLFSEGEKGAREKKLGLWGSSLPTNQNQCLIKGNISSSGEKIYHLPGGGYYDKTVIEESKGERWFCTEEEAQTAGWRKSKL